MTKHISALFEAGPETVHWGYFDGRLPAIATIESGDTIRVTTVSGNPDIVAETPFQPAPALLAIHEHVRKRTIPGHICTGPIAVRGAKAGEVLQIDIEDLELTSNWGYAAVRPLTGGLPDDFDERRVTYVSIDQERAMGQLPWGMDLPLRPFLGVLAVAPPPAWGEIPTRPPRQNGGNLDNKELVPGSTLYLPIFVDGAQFSVGDGHAAQGDGEICNQAVETDLAGVLTLTVRPDMHLTWPVAETPTHIITMAFDPDLDDAVEIAIRQMIGLLGEHVGLDRYQAYTLLSFVGDLRVTQIVNGNKGIHLMVDKRYFNGKSLKRSSPT